MIYKQGFTIFAKQFKTGQKKFLNPVRLSSKYINKHNPLQTRIINIKKLYL